MTGFTCCVCGKPATKGLMGLGWFCSSACADILKADDEARTQELLAEPLGDMPEALTVGDFERWAHKLAVHHLAGLTDEQREQMRRGNPMMLRPSELAAELKSLILDYLPGASRTRARGHERLFHDGTYTWAEPIKREAVVAAAQKAGVIA